MDIHADLASLDKVLVHGWGAEGHKALGVLVLQLGVDGTGDPLGGQVILEGLVLATPHVALGLHLAQGAGLAFHTLGRQTGTLGGQPPAVTSGEGLDAADHTGEVWRGPALAVLDIRDLLLDDPAGVVLGLDELGQHLVLVPEELVRDVLGLDQLVQERLGVLLAHLALLEQLLALLDLHLLGGAGHGSAGAEGEAGLDWQRAAGSEYDMKTTT